MTSQDKDRYIVEWFGGTHNSVCYSFATGWLKTPDLTTWEGFGWLWPKMRTWNDGKLWMDFINYISRYLNELYYGSLMPLIDHPDKFRDAVYEFLKSQEK